MDKVADVLFEFKDSEVPLRVRDLERYFYFFEFTYQITVKLVGAVEHDAVLNSKDQWKARFSEQMAAFNFEQVSQYYSISPGADPALVIKQISYESPLRIWIAGNLSAIVLAVIVSGGDIDLEAAGGKLKVHLPPVGTGVEKVLEAFQEKTAIAKDVKSVGKQLGGGAKPE